MAEVYRNLVVAAIIVMEGVNRAVFCITAVTLEGMGLGDHESGQPLAVAACAVTDLCIAL